MEYIKQFQKYVFGTPEFDKELICMQTSINNLYTLLRFRCRKFKYPWNSVISAMVGSIVAPFSLFLYIKIVKIENTCKITFVKFDRFSFFLFFFFDPVK